MEPEEPAPKERAPLSPEEEDAFAAIAFGLGDRERTRIPWRIVTVSVPVVGIGVIGAALLGAPGAAVVLFCLTFTVALSLGLLVVAVSDRRTRPR
jgi:hypothetical protein